MSHSANSATTSRAKWDKVSRKANTTFGSAWLLNSLVKSLKYVDVRLIYAFASLFVMPVCLLLNTNHSRTTAYRYLRHRQGLGRMRSAWLTYVNHCRFAEVVIDRFAMYAGKRFKLQVERYDEFLRRADGEEGFMLLSSHIGCYEIVGYTLVSKRKRFNALVFGGEKATVMEGRQQQFDSNNIRMIPILPDMSHLFLVNESLANHEIVSMPADRCVGSAKTVECQLLGATASLPLGPFSVATMRGLDVLAVNVMKTSRRGYTAYVTPLAYDKEAPRREQMRQLAQSYASELEARIRQYPEQWFNFYDFWK